MNVDQMALLVRSVKALCPAQKFDEFTPDAWFDVIGDLDYNDAYEAMRTLARKQPFIGPSDICGEVIRTRRNRPSWPPGAGREALEADIPNVDNPDDWRGYNAALQANRNRRYTAQELKSWPVQKAIEGAFQRVEPTYRHVDSKWNRSAIALPAPEALPPAKPDEDPELADAQAILREIGGIRAWYIAARAELETEGVALTKRTVAIRAADLATRPEAEVP